MPGTIRNSLVWISGKRLPPASVTFALLILSGLVRIAAAQSVPTFTVLYTFTGGADGAEPLAGLIADSAGNLYGTTQYGGASGNHGTVFKLDSAGHETVLYSFTGGVDGYGPSAGLIQDAAHNLYGTTCCDGGAFGVGVVFKLDSTGHQRVLHTFTGGADGGYSVAGLIRDKAGTLYGTTEIGGNSGCNPPSGCGVVFQLDAAGNETVLHSFTGADGRDPNYAALVRDAAGNLYGTTAAGGDTACSPPSGCGVVFKLDPAGNETVLHRFAGADGSFPYGGLIQDAAGNLYGTTVGGGPSDSGVVFKLDPAGNETVLYSFRNSPDGSGPVASLIRDPAGNLYGTTVGGGGKACRGGCGVVFVISPTGSERVLHKFTGGTDGAAPYSGLLAHGGSLYGTAREGGAGFGVVFKISQ